MGGGCKQHKVVVAMPVSQPRPSAASSIAATRPSGAGANQYQDAVLSDEDALAAALEISRQLHPSSSSDPSSSVHVAAPATVGASSTASTSQTPVVSSKPRCTSQLGGAWIVQLDADAIDELEKQNALVAKAEAAAEAKKAVDVMWYDRVSVSRLLSDS
jgi:hypothetical protein